MKYTIVVNQRTVADVNETIEDKNKKLDLVDCAILEWIIQICNSKDARVCNSREADMTWISYQKIIDDMPLLGITTKGAMTRRLAKLRDGQFIKLSTKNQRTYVDYTLKAEKLSYEYGQNTANKPLPYGNGGFKTVAREQRNRCRTATNKNTITSFNKRTKIHERNTKVKDDLNIPGIVRAKAMKDFITQRDPNETFVIFFRRNQGRYIPA